MLLYHMYLFFLTVCVLVCSMVHEHMCVCDLVARVHLVHGPSIHVHQYILRGQILTPTTN